MLKVSVNPEWEQKRETGESGGCRHCLGVCLDLLAALSVSERLGCEASVFEEPL